METDNTPSRPVQAPVAARHPHAVESPNGTRIDDYYWLRDDERSDPQVLEHLARENAYADAVLRPLAALEQELYEELTGRLAPDDDSVPVRYRGYWYFTRYTPGHEYPQYWRRADREGADGELLLDVNVLAAGHDYFQVGDWSVSPDGTRLAYTRDTVGRRQYELRVLDLASHEELPDRVVNIESEILWAADSRTLLYIEKDPETLLSVRVHAHTLGARGPDRLLYEEADHSYFLGLDASRSEEMLFIACSSTEQTQWHYAGADDPALAFRPVLPRDTGHEYEVEHLEGDFVLRTNRAAPNFRIVRVPQADVTDPSAWRDIVAHREDVFLEGFEVARQHLAVEERANGLARVRIHRWSDGGVLAQDVLVEGEEAASAVTLVATPDIDSPDIRTLATGLATPATTYDYGLADGARHWRKTERVGGGFDAQRYTTRHVVARADDGARIPVSIAWRRDTPLDGSAPVYQYGYGAYGYSLDPGFRPSWVSLMDRGFVVAIAHVRGGQELGRRWYDEGRLLAKRNSFTDFVAVTRMLVDERYGAADRICAQGGSAGGLLMGAVANLAPRRYRAIVAHVPFVDVVTTMLDESIPLTTNEFDQWGDPRDERYYRAMLDYSPYDNVRAQEYPAMLVFTGLWDSQVQYFEPAKWVARLRACKTDTHPLLFCVDLQSGHGGKSGRFERYREVAREYAFLLWQLGKAGAPQAQG
jgi:oligopeptidase B